MTAEDWEKAARVGLMLLLLLGPGCARWTAYRLEHHNWDAGWVETGETNGVLRWTVEKWGWVEE
jgi:hypothetical protein